MAAPRGRYLFWRHIPRILLGLPLNKQCSDSRMRIRFRVPCRKLTNTSRWVDRGLWSLAQTFFASTPSQPGPWDGASPTGKPPADGTSGMPPDNQKKPAERHLKLMDFPERIWPHPVKSFRNFFFAMLIRGYFDKSFSHENFLQGAVQAACHVSDLLSKGEFEKLNGLVASEAMKEIQRNYEELNVKQRSSIAVNPKDLFYQFIYEIGMIFDSKTDQRFVEITTVLHGFHGLDEARGTEAMQEKSFQEFLAAGQFYICNYRLIREYTKGTEDDWTINKLNHFTPAEVANVTNLFRR